MKAMLRRFGALGCALFFMACANNVSHGSPDVTPGTVGSADPAIVAAASAAKSMSADDVVLFYYRKDGSYTPWGLWIWPTGSDEGQVSYDATVGKAKQSGGVGYWNISELAPDVLKSIKDKDNTLNFIIRNASWTKDPGTDQTGDLSSATKFIVLSGDSAVYEVSDNVSPSIVSAVATSKTAINAQLSVTLGLETSESSNGFSLVSEDGRTVAVSDVRNADSPNDRNRNNARNILITCSPLDITTEWYLKHPSFSPEKGIRVSMQGAVKESPEYSGNDLGLTISGSKVTFKVWAPLASQVNLLLYTDVTKVGTFKEGNNPKSIGSTTDVTLKGDPALAPSMTQDKTTGVWSYTLDNSAGYKYYKYQIVNDGTTYYVCDINAKAASPDAIAAQIVDINSDQSAIPGGVSYGTKASYKNPFTGSYTDAVIYEMHITDWSYAEDTSTGNVGKYLTIANGTKVIEHLKDDMKVTHVQILPVFEFAETNANTDYNWGYNPYHYNVPEGRYVTAGYTDGTQAVLELRTLIAKLHEAGIAVIMDVVYNHTSGTEGYSLYDSTVPYYYYRMDNSGGYSNGSGCGNEVDTEAPMMKKYIINSLKHWMLDYHFNGFRFDLMGCLSKETMQEIYDELREIDSSVMVYGEPWTGGTAAVVDGTTQAVSSKTGMGAGAFDDDFRDAIKGAEFGGFKKGQVQGIYNDTAIINGLLSKSGNNKRNETGKPGLALHYVECHDNYTLFDKLAISYLNKTESSGDLFAKIEEDGLAEVKRQDKLAAAYVFLSQGTAFMNGGQEFLRSKRGNENSYNANSTGAKPVNWIDLEYKEKYSDVYNTYKGLIALRRANPAAFGSNSSAKAEKVSDGVTKYTTGSFLVYFNATDKAVSISASGYTKAVDVSGGTPEESAKIPSSVPAKSFVILKK